MWRHRALLPALLLWLGVVGVALGAALGAALEAARGAALGGVTHSILECPEVRRTPTLSAAGPAILAQSWPPDVKAALAAARALWGALDPRAAGAAGAAGRLTGPEDWTRMSRDLLNENSHVEAVAVQTTTMRLLLHRRSDGLRSYMDNASSMVGAKGYWHTLQEYSKGAGLAGRGGRWGELEGRTLPNPLWPHPFYDCSRGLWLFAPSPGIYSHNSTMAAVFFNIALVEVDPCDETWGPLLYGGHRCDPNTTLCVSFHLGERRSYRCQCRYGFGPFTAPTGGPLNDSHIEPPQFSCSPCPEDDPRCGLNNDWEEGVRMGMLVGQGISMALVLILAIVVFKKRKCKIVASSMWVVLETLLLGALLLQTSVALRFVEPSLWMCLLEPWCREMGFVICYGSIILKLYRILVEFRTRKAHRWVLKDRDLLRHLGAMVLAVFAYLAALTAASLHFYNEGFQLLDTVTTDDGMVYPHCKVFWWDWVTQAAELVSLLVGLHLAWVSRNFNMQFNERAFLSAALLVELFASATLYALRLAARNANLSPATVLAAYFAREQVTTTIVLLLVFTPVLWLAMRQPAARSLLPTLDTLNKPVDGAGGPGGAGFHSSDVDVTEITLKDMNPDDIRAELKRLYTQLEVLRNKNMRHNNPHISKRRGGRKVAHRRFSLQKRGSREKALHHRHMRSSARHHTDVEVTEAEGSRTPEDSVCSQEGPSAVFNDGPSTYSEYGFAGYGTPSVSYKHKQ